MSPLRVGVSHLPMEDIKIQKKVNKLVDPVDAKLRHLRDKILPEVPFILGVKRSQIYRHHPQVAHQWRRGTPFARDEEELQYLTFKDRTNDGTELYVRGGWDDGKGGIAPPEGTLSRNSSDGTPYSGQGPKKKISLADYKNRDKNKVPIAHPKPSTLKAMADTRNDGNKVRAIAKETMKSQQAEQQGQKRCVQCAGIDLSTLKLTGTRSADMMTGVKDPDTFNHPLPIPLPKKPRMTPDLPKGSVQDTANSSTQQQEAHADVVNHTADTNKPTASEPIDRKMFASVVTQISKSLVEEQSVEKRKNHDLPPMLSPTLPAGVEELLAQMTPRAKGGGGSAANSKTSSASSTSKLFRSDHASSPINQNLLRKPKVGHSTPATPSKASQATRELTSPSTILPLEAMKSSHDPHRRAAGVHPEAGSNHAIKAVANGVINGRKGSPASISRDGLSPGLKLKIKLKISKKHRKFLHSYLRLPPTPGKYPTRVGGVETKLLRQIQASELKGRGSAPSNEIETKEGRKQKGPDFPKAGDKRGRPQDDREVLEPSAKRQKERNHAPKHAMTAHRIAKNSPEPAVKPQKPPNRHPQKTHTSRQPSISSPIASYTGNTQKGRLATPQADVKSTAMHRVGSGQGTAATPLALNLGATPNAPSSAEKAPQRDGKNLFKEEANRYHNLATDIKHDSDVYLKKAEMTEEERKLGVVIGTESILCFMLAFTIIDEPKRSAYKSGDPKANRSDDPKQWRSILNFLSKKVRAESRNFPHISGVLFQLEGIIRDTVHFYEETYLKNNPLSREFISRCADPPAQEDIASRATEYQRQYIEMLSNSQKSLSAWQAAKKCLPIDTLISDFPKTWSKRASSPGSGKGNDAVTIGTYGAGGFSLPLDGMSTGLEAVRYGLSILQEWCRKEGVQWVPKLVL